MSIPENGIDMAKLRKIRGYFDHVDHVDGLPYCSNNHKPEQRKAVSSVRKQDLRRDHPRLFDFESSEWHLGFLDGYRPDDFWHDQPATDKQVEALEWRGFRPPESVTKGEAAFVLDRPTPKQRRVLERRGLWDAGMTFSEAREALDAVAREEGWAKG
jgi:hypothetical protein